MADQIAARSIRASLAQTCHARIVQHRQGTGPDLCARYRLHRLAWAGWGDSILEAGPRIKSGVTLLLAKFGYAAQMPLTQFSPYLWTPGLGPDPAALSRMVHAFPKPATPMGEAWFMASERQMYPQLFGDLNALPDDEIVRALEEITSGPTCFGPHAEWVEWYHYLLPRLIGRTWEPTFWQPAELLISAFMAQHPASDGALPYSRFKEDALVTLGQYIMSPHFWPDGQFDHVNCLSKWTGPNGIAGWYSAGNLLSASLFFCLKYLVPGDVERWFRSVLAILNSYWQVQVITWLVGAHPILTGEIQQPNQFPETGSFDVAWNWSHSLDGHYTGSFEQPIRLTPFLPVRNREIVVQIAREAKVAALLEDLWTDPVMEVVMSETAGMPERFLQLYGTQSPQPD